MVSSDESGERRPRVVVETAGAVFEGGGRFEGRLGLEGPRVLAEVWRGFALRFFLISVGPDCAAGSGVRIWRLGGWRGMGHAINHEPSQKKSGKGLHFFFD